jgi:putative ABC transport system permease protein
VHVIGLVKGKPAFFAQNSAPVIYVPLETLQHFTGQDNPPVVSRIGIYIRSGASFDDFKTRWTDRLAKLDTNLVLQMKRDSGGELERNLWSIRLMSYLGGVVSMLTAMFITFSALSMGVTERQRSLAMLRAIGGTRSQVFRLVLLEGFVLSLIGLVIGVLLGILWINLLCWKYADVFSSGAVVSIGGIIFAAAGALLTVVAASILPAWSASRVDPLEAMNAHAGSSGPGKAPVKWALIGLPLIAIDPFLFFGPIESIVSLFHVKNIEVSSQYVRLFGHFVVGLPGIVFGLFLMAPLVVWTIDKIASWSIAAVLRMPVALIRQQLSCGIWRASGTAAALMVGLGTLIVMQVQGHTLIGGWRLPDKFPDIFIWGSDIISWQDQQKMGSIPGIEPGTLMPVVVTTPAGDSKTSLVIAAALSGGKNPAVMFFAVDPQQALGMIDLEFRDNDGKPFPPDQQAAWRAKTVEEMKKGRRIIVTEEFRQARHLKIGDPFPVQTSRNGLQTYTICGIVWSPGVDVIVSMYDVERVLDQQTVGSVFGSIDDAKNDFGAGGARLFAANLRGVDKVELLKEVQKSLGDRGLQAGDIRQIKYQIESTFFRILTLMSTVAFAALAVASLGVTNTIMASVRTRRWQFGVLRSVGVTRSELVRLVLAEAILLGIVGVVLGVAAGAETSVDARELSRVVLGYSPPFQIPWLVVGIGCCSVILVAFLASFWPAMNVAYTEPLDLLQAGRASA